MRKIVFNLLLMLMVIWVIYIGISKIDTFPQKNIWNNKEKSEDVEHHRDEDVESIEGDAVKKVRYEMEEGVSFGPITYKVNSVTTSKETVNFPTPTNWSELYTFDSEGTLIDGNSYIIVNITIKNNKNEILEFYLNSMNLLVTKDLETRTQDYSECLSASNIENFGRKDFFRIELEPSKEYNYDLVFIAPDTSIDNNEGALIIDRQGEYPIEESEDKKRFINIKFR